MSVLGFTGVGFLYKNTVKAIQGKRLSRSSPYILKTLSHKGFTKKPTPVKSIRGDRLINWRVQSSANKQFTVKTESITGETLQHLQVSIET